MPHKLPPSASKVLGWFMLGLSLICLYIGVVAWLSSDGHDVGGVVGLFFGIPALWLAWEAVPMIFRSRPAVKE